MATTIRPRRDDDVEPLVEILERQRPGSGYPALWPVPDKAGFIARRKELGAWVAEVDGKLAGHVSVLYVEPRTDPEGQRALEACEAYHGVPAEQLAMVAALFVDTDATGHGVGRALMDVATSAIADGGYRACLEVIEQHRIAIVLYEKLGWVRILDYWPWWLKQTEDGPAIAMVLPCASP